MIRKEHTHKYKTGWETKNTGEKGRVYVWMYGGSPGLIVIVILALHVALLQEREVRP